MMGFTFRPAVRENVGLLIGLAGGTGSGKTFSAFRLASGISGGKPFAVIDTESRRALHYADQFAFHHAEIRPPFRPETYSDAIQAADAAGYPVIIVDSVSHEWSGDGGILDWQAEEYERLGAREATKLLSWSVPKQGHKRFVSKMLQARAHLILCFRAEPHVEMIKEDGKTKIVPKQGLTGLNGWFPVTEKNLPFEMTASFLLTADAPGVPKPIKLQNQHRPLFPLDKPITEESGKLIAEWAAGGTKAPDKPSTIERAVERANGATINANQAADLDILLSDHGISKARLLQHVGVAKLRDIPADQFQRVMDYVNKQIEAKAKA